MRNTSLYSCVQTFSQSNACRIYVRIHSLWRETHEPKELPVSQLCEQIPANLCIFLLQNQKLMTNHWRSLTIRAVGWEGLSRRVSRTTCCLYKAVLHRRISGSPETWQPETGRCVIFGERTVSYVPIAQSRYQRQLWSLMLVLVLKAVT